MVTHLQFPPQPALVTTHTVHDAGDVTKMLPKLLLQLASLLSSGEHTTLIEMIRKWPAQNNALKMPWLGSGVRKLYHDMCYRVLRGFGAYVACSAECDRVTFCRACNTHRVTQKNGNFWNA